MSTNINAEKQKRNIYNIIGKYSIIALCNQFGVK